MSNYPPDTAWWISWEGDQKGPISTPQLKRWLAEGRVAPDLLVRPGTDGPWILAKTVRFSGSAKPADWQAVIGGTMLAAGLLLAAEAFFLSLTHSGAAHWAFALLAGYAVLATLLWPRSAPKDSNSKK
ncbi:MAG: GYF domain-containing protein [Planctomycetota bacterium]